MGGGNRGPVRWLADTGCPADLIGLNDMAAGDLQMIEQANDTICFNTAKGSVWANSVLEWFEGAASSATPQLVRHTQTLSVAKFIPLKQIACSAWRLFVL